MERRSSRNAAAVESRAAVTVRPGVESRAAVTVWPAVEFRASVTVWPAVEFRASVKFRAAVESGAAAVEMVPVHEGSAVRDIPAMVVHPAVAAPVGVPAVPSPAESSVEAEPETDSERNPRAGDGQAAEPEHALAMDQ